MRTKQYLILTLSVLTMLSVITGCRSEEDKRFDELTAQSPTTSAQASQTGEGRRLSGKLRISLPSRWGPLEVWASRFEELHPDVNIQFEYETEETYIDPPSGIYFEGEDYAATELPASVADSYIRKTAVSLSGGESADIIDLGPMALYKYGESGLFEDFNQLMASDPDFHREDYYTNILDALEDQEGHLYGLPPVVRFKFIMLNDYILYDAGVDVDEEFPDGVNYENLTDLFWRAAEAGALDPDTGDGKGCYFAPRTNKSFFQEFVIPQFLDEKSGEARFDTPEFIDYLKRVDRLPFEYTMEKTPHRQFGWPDFLIREDFDIRQCFCQKMAANMQIMNISAGQGRYMGSTRGLLYKDSQGSVPFSIDMVLLAIPKGGNVKMAWEFVKFMIEEKEFPGSVWQDSVSENQEYVHPYNQSIPINRNNFKKLSTALYGKYFIGYIEPYVEQMNTRLGTSSELLVNLEEIFASYFDHHLISAEECAKQLQERAWIYLNE